MDEDERGRAQKKNESIELDIEKDKIGRLSITERNLSRLPCSVLGERPLKRRNAMNLDGKDELLTISSDSEDAPPRLEIKRDPFRGIEKAVHMFSANLDEQIGFQIFEEK